MARAVIVAGGQISRGTHFGARADDFVICADSGYHSAVEMGLSPDILVGDMDSFRGELPSEIQVIRAKSEKDETDTHLAVIEALSRGCDEILILGGAGGRFDHTMANIWLLKLILDSGATGWIIDGNNRITVINKKTTLKKDAGYISVLPIFGGAKGVCLQGFKYPLSGANLASGAVVGISNEIVSSDAAIDIRDGYLLVIRSMD